MRAISIVCIVVASLGLFLSLCMLGDASETVIGYGFWQFLFNGLFLALAIASVNRK